jgi:iron-sulfur cluster assembly 2
MSLTTLPPVEYFPSNSIREQPSPALNTSSNYSNAMPSRGPGDSPTREDTKVGKLDEDDTVFAADDGSGARVVMDGPSLELLKGSKIDFTMELIGSQFKIVDNPLATSSCGCGTSFDIKA